MPGFKASEEVKAWSLPENAEVLFFGGSFNPWHEGHSACLKLAPKHLPTLVMPDINPFKMNHDYSENHLESLKRALSLHDDFKLLALYTYFFEMKKPNPTHVWIDYVKNQRPDLKLNLLMGFDAFKQIHHWLEAEKLLSDLSAIYVVSRQEDKMSDQEQLGRLKESYPQLMIHFLGHHPFEHVSSTELRQKKGKP
jgi:nicotinate-nucleotide adenylyltransferase